jgi:flagellar hook assembly protein FlgD
MIYSSTIGEEKVTFKYYNGALDQLFDLRESIDFQSDMIVGNGLNTFELNGGNVELVEGLNINAAYPNPFNPVTNIEYTLSQAENVEITVYDIMGRQVETIYNGFQSNGIHSIAWDASNKSSGIYYIQIKSNNIIKTEKVVLMK